MDPQDRLSRLTGNETAIVAVLLHYFPGFDPPDDRYEWNPCLCPAHDEDRPSCSINYRIGAIRCQACGFKGDVVSIVRRKEDVTHAEALRLAADILAASDIELPPQPARKPGRRAFGSSGADRRDRAVPARVRGRSTPWS